MMIYSNDARFRILNSNFSNNIVVIAGGAIMDYANLHTYYENVTFSSNRCIKGEGGDMLIKLT